MPRNPPPPANLNAFGHEVARLRRARHLTIEDLAERSGVSRQTVINIENSHKGLRLTTAHAIAFALEVPLADLIHVL